MISPYINTVLLTNVMVQPNQMNNNLYLHIKDNLCKKVEKKCFGNYGYVMNVIKVLKYERGEIVAENFSASANFDVTFSCRLCAPIKNTMITCEIKIINKNIIQLKNGPPNREPLLVVVTSDRIDTELFSYNMHGYLQYKKNNTMHLLEQGDLVNILLEAVTFNDNDNKIIAIGYLSSLASENDKKNYYESIYRTKMEEIEYKEHRKTVEENT